MIEGGERYLKLMKIVMYWQQVRILKFLAEIVGKAIACLESVGDIVQCSVVRASKMDDG